MLEDVAAPSYFYQAVPRRHCSLCNCLCRHFALGLSFARSLAVGRPFHRMFLGGSSNPSRSVTSYRTRSKSCQFCCRLTSSVSCQSLSSPKPLASPLASRRGGVSASTSIGVEVPSSANMAEVNFDDETVHILQHRRIPVPQIALPTVPGLVTQSFGNLQVQDHGERLVRTTSRHPCSDSHKLLFRLLVTRAHAQNALRFHQRKSPSRTAHLHLHFPEQCFSLDSYRPFWFNQCADEIFEDFNVDGSRLSSNFIFPGILEQPKLYQSHMAARSSAIPVFALVAQCVQGLRSPGILIGTQSTFCPNRNG